MSPTRRGAQACAPVTSSKEELGPGQPLHRARYVTPAVLILLRERPDHGYALLQRLPTLLPRHEERPNFSVVYRTLKALEHIGVVRAWLDDRETGPRRRLYALTEDGGRVLDRWLALLEAERATITRLLASSGL